MHRTWSVVLVSRLAGLLKAYLVQYVLHRDFVAQCVEVDTSHHLILIETTAVLSRRSQKLTSTFRF